MNFSTNNELDMDSSGFGNFISYMKHSDDIWYIKDHESRFIYMNGSGNHYCSLPRNYDVEGKLDSECPTYLSEFSEVLQANDKLVMKSQKVLPVLFTATYGGRLKSVQPFIEEVSPLIKDGKSIGVVGVARKIDIYSMHHLANNKCADSLIFGNPTELFTDKEFEVIFYALQSLSVKEIARRLNISPNTVKKYLLSIYEKADVSALNQFIEYCRGHGYDKYAPSRFACSQPFVRLKELTSDHI